jgi:hypothetical protein
MIDILYLTWNRREFTQFSLQMLLDNTDWSQVRYLVVHDDGSDKGQNIPKMIVEMLTDAPVETKLHFRDWEERLGSPPAVMNWYVETYGDSERFAKIDSDIVVPPDWLTNLLGVVGRQPHIELLGMEAGRMGPPGHNGIPWDWERPTEGYGFEKGSHIGGVGLMKTESFRIRPKMREGEGRFGFTEWQHEYKPIRGWITPDLLISELTRIPFEPWASLSAGYAERDWERDWPPYHPRWRYWWSWWPEEARKGETWSAG